MSHIPLFHVHIYLFPVAVQHPPLPFDTSGVSHIWHNVQIFDSGPIVRLILPKTRPQSCKLCWACDDLLHIEAHSEDRLAMHIHCQYFRNFLCAQGSLKTNCLVHDLLPLFCMKRGE